MLLLRDQCNQAEMHSLPTSATHSAKASAICIIVVLALHATTSHAATSPCICRLLIDCSTQVCPAVADVDDSALAANS